VTGEASEAAMTQTSSRPRPGTPKIENLLAFFNEKTDIVVDGAPQERPVTKWS
jgi:hypothetical protein